MTPSEFQTLVKRRSAELARYYHRTLQVKAGAKVKSVVQLRSGQQVGTDTLTSSAFMRNITRIVCELIPRFTRKKHIFLSLTLRFR